MGSLAMSSNTPSRAGSPPNGTSQPVDATSWGLWGTRVFPEPLEQEFQANYRRAGLKFNWVACLIGAAAFLAFVVIQAVWPVVIHNVPQQASRLGLAAWLIVNAALAARAPSLILRYYIPYQLIAMGVVVLGNFVHLSSIGEQAPSSMGYAGQGWMLLIFIGYGFQRLPLKVALVQGIAIQALAILTFPTGWQEESAIVRGAVYLTIANAVGVILLMIHERRERQLFIKSAAAAESAALASKSAQRAKEATDEMVRYLEAVSHDLRQPLSALTLNVETLNRLYRTGKDMAPAIQNLSASVDSLTRQVETVLQIARYRSGSAVHRIKPVDMAPLLTDVIATFSAAAAAQGTELRVMAVDPDCVALTDSMAVQSMIGNLVGNALKFRSDDRKHQVRVRARRRGPAVFFTVSDTGLGIDRQSRIKIWTPYFQVGNPERNPSKGFGLGLAVVASAARKLPGHRVRLASVPGKGSVFCVRMPWAQTTSDELERPARSTTGEDPATLDGVRILVVDDDLLARQALAHLLALSGARVTSVKSAEAGYDAVENGLLPDVLICDFRLPGANGIAAIEGIRRLAEKEIPAILVSGEAGDLEAECSRLTAVRYMRKPVRPADLLKDINFLLLLCAADPMYPGMGEDE